MVPFNCSSLSFCLTGEGGSGGWEGGDEVWSWCFFLLWGDGPHSITRYVLLPSASGMHLCTSLSAGVFVGGEHAGHPPTLWCGLMEAILPCKQNHPMAGTATWWQCWLWQPSEQPAVAGGLLQHARVSFSKRGSGHWRRALWFFSHCSTTFN